MRLGIRAKLVVTLVLVVLLPLMALLGATLDRWSALRRDMAAQVELSLAAVEARAWTVRLSKDVQNFDVMLNDQVMAAELMGHSTKLPDEELKRLDKAWATMSGATEPMATILDPHSPIVSTLLSLQRRNPAITQALVTDAFGQLVAATGRTGDFYQADEDWWVQAYDQGKGRIFISEVTFDPPSRTYTLNVCLPLTDQGKLLGIAKIKMDVMKILAESEPPQAMPAQPMLVRHDGLIIYRRGVEPLTVRVPNWSEAVMQQHPLGWQVTSDDELQAFAPIRLPPTILGLEVKMQPMVIGMYTSRSAVTTPITRFVMYMSAVGLLIIAAIFVVGMLLTDHAVVRRLSQLEQVARKVAGGDLSISVPAQTRPWWLLGGRDEIDDLASDFDEMLRRVRQSHQELKAANELKTNFIRVASHELRTPISYILGLARLLKDNNDPVRLTNALQSVASRAKRLDDIIHAMFKLMPDAAYQETVQYQDISVAELVEEIHLDVFPFVERRSQQLLLDLPDDLPTIRVDHAKIRDVIENLLINAIKFTPDHGEIRLVVRRAGEMLTIAVQDQGPGIPAGELPHIFQPFYSGPDVLKHSTGDIGYQKRGMGLGLAIVRHYVELHHGTVNVSSGPAGTTFTVYIPIRLGGKPASQGSTDQGVA